MCIADKGQPHEEWGGEGGEGGRRGRRVPCIASKI